MLDVGLFSKRSDNVAVPDPLPGWVISAPVKLHRRLARDWIVLNIGRRGNEPAAFWIDFSEDDNWLVVGRGGHGMRQDDQRLQLNMLLPVDAVASVEIQEVVGRDAFMRARLKYVEPLEGGESREVVIDFRTFSTRDVAVDCRAPLYWKTLRILSDRLADRDASRTRAGQPDA